MPKGRGWTLSLPKRGRAERRRVCTYAQGGDRVGFSEEHTAPTETTATRFVISHNDTPLCACTGVPRSVFGFEGLRSVTNKQVSCSPSFPFVTHRELHTQSAHVRTIPATLEVPAKGSYARAAGVPSDCDRAPPTPACSPRSRPPDLPSAPRAPCSPRALDPASVDNHRVHKLTAVASD